ncbi:MAG: FadR/GntR family transcriptional regulator [Gammaproteobacteria bacterium]|nr:FadR/GntR family transcriptional regulator [Gammaproteobacteria bacterium]
MNKIDKISQAIEGDIHQCRWLPGDKLPGQLALMERFNASRTCLREAIAELEAKGLVTSQHGSGCYVNNLFEPQFSGPMSGIELDSSVLQLSVMEMRLVLEGEAAKYVCERATDNELAAIEQEFNVMGLRSGNTLQRAKADLKFHMLIAESSHNLLVVSLSQLLYTQFFNAIYGTLDSVITLNKNAPEQFTSRVYGQHSAIYKAIMKRDGKAAKFAAQEHVRYSMSLLKEQTFDNFEKQ